jgi:hypothetical protein
MHCSFCHHPLTPATAWKGTADRLYCSEFCADSETVIPARSHPPKEEIDQQYLARLERLLPLRRTIHR